MQLIEWRQSHGNYNNLNQNELKSKFNNQQNTRIQNQNNISKTSSLFLSKQSQFILLKSVQIKLQKAQLSVKSTIIDQKIELIDTKIKKLIIIRAFLKFNSKMQNINFLINPLTGEKCLRQSVLILQNIELTHGIYQNIIQQYTNICNQKIGLLDLVNDTSSNMVQNITQSSPLKIPFKKEYLYSSNQYAWNILQGKTHNIRNNQIYTESKRKFKSSKFIHKTNFVINNLTSVHNQQIKQLEGFNTLTQNEDNELRQNYLEKTLTINKNSRQIQEITIPPEAFAYLLTKKEAKVNCCEVDKIRINIRTYPQSRCQSLKHQRKILQKLPKTQFIGLPKYYFVKNIVQSETQLYRFTNLINMKQWNHFLQANSQSLSIYTLFSIFNQLCVILRYLRDYNIVFHGLRPENIVVKKGLIVNFMNLQNSYCQSVNDPDYTIKNYLPYISNIQLNKETTINDEKSDVYSFGILAYSIIFNKTPHNIKDITYKQTSDKDIQSKLSKPTKFCMENMNSMGLQILRRFIYTIFMCIDHGIKQKKSQKIEKINNQEGVKQKQLTKNRPYLDWISIMTRNILQYLNNIK